MNTTGLKRLLCIAGLCLMASSASFAEMLASDGWSRQTPPGAKVGVGYLVLKNTGGELRKLLRVTASVGEEVTLHQSSIDAQGQAHMWPMASLHLRAGETVRFEPGGKHLMLMGLKEPLKAGQIVKVIFQFDGGAAPVTVDLNVRPLVATAAQPGMAPASRPKAKAATKPVEKSDQHAGHEHHSH